MLSVDDDPAEEHDALVFDLRVLEVLSTIPTFPSRSFADESTELFLIISSGFNESKRADGASFMRFTVPILRRVPLDSPLHKAVSAVAVNMAVLWSPQRSGSSLHRQYYVRAVNSIRKALLCPDRSRDDDMLMAVLLMDFCDALNARFRGDLEYQSRSHQMGALALVKHRGDGNWKNEASRAMMGALHSDVVQNALQSSNPVPQNLLNWFEDSQMAQGPLGQLDRLMLPLTNALSRAKHALKTIPRVKKTILADLQTEFIDLDRQFVAWYGRLPKDYAPRLLWGQKIPIAIRKAGLYRDQCSVYQDLHLARMLNGWRICRIMLLHTLKDCTIALHASETIAEQFMSPETDQVIQLLVDEICDSVPFFLGDYAGRVPPLQHSPLSFPQYVDADGTFPENPKAHAWHATCVGSWLILTPLINLSCFFEPCGSNPASHAS